MVVSEAGKIKPLTTGIVVERATRRASTRKNRLILTKPDQGDPNLRADKDRTTLRALGEPKWALPS